MIRHLAPILLLIGSVATDLLDSPGEHDVSKAAAAQHVGHVHETEGGTWSYDMEPPGPSEHDTKKFADYAEDNTFSSSPWAPEYDQPGSYGYNDFIYDQEIGDVNTDNTSDSSAVDGKGEEITERKKMDPIVILAIVIGVSVFLTAVTAVGLLVLVRSRCTLSPPEPTLITYHPHSNSMETSFTEVHEEAMVKQHENTVCEAEDNLANVTSENPMASPEKEVSAGVKSAPNSTQLLVTTGTPTIVRPRPRPSFTKGKIVNEPQTLISSGDETTKDVAPQKPARTGISKREDLAELDHPEQVRKVVLRKKKRSTTPNSFPSETSDRKILTGNGVITTVATIEVSPKQNRDNRRSEPVFSKPNPIDAMHSVLLSMDSADDSPMTSPSTSYSLLHSYESLGQCDEQEFNERVNPLYVSSQTIDSRVASFMMKPNPCLLAEHTDLSDSLHYSWSQDGDSAHVCSPDHCHYPVFFTQSCPNSPLFVKKFNGNDQDIDKPTAPVSDEANDAESTNPSKIPTKSTWRSETNLSLLNQLNGCNVYLRPAMNGEQLLNSHVCPSAWLISPQYIDDRWEMRTTF